MFIEFKDVSFKYYGSDEYVFNQLSFAIEKGSMLAILGHNGSGKSTIAKLMMGLLETTSGDIYIEGEKLTEDNVDVLRKKMGIIFQNPDNQFVGVTVRDDIAFGLENHKIPRKEMIEKIDKYAKLVNMQDFLDENPENLSGGQKQRVAIAGALAMDTDLIIFDESTSMLDPKGTKEIHQMIETLRKTYHKTIISITHNLEEALIADRVIVLNEGKIVLDGTPKEVLKEQTILEASGLKLIDGISLLNRIQDSKLHINKKEEYSKKASYKQLDQVSLNINEKDEFVMIVGHTGSGKSTLVQHMNGLLLATSGRVEVFNINVIRSKKIKLKPVREHVGLVFQFPEYQIFESTVLEDIMFGPKNFGKSKEEAKQLAIQAAHRIGINDEILERSPFTLSGGQMRRVAIAGAMAINPDILILDEPTVGLDPKGKDELMNLLVHMHNETHKTIIMISHDMDIVASYAKRILVMDQGKLIYDGDKEGLFADEEFLRQHNLDLPVISTIAKGLKAKGFIQYDQLPLTKDELYDIIVGGKTNE